MEFTIHKPWILKRMDKLSRKPALMRKALRDLEKRTDLSLVELGLLSGYLSKKRTEAAHLRDDLFDQRKGWWAGLADIESVARKALIKAGRLALRYKLPSDSYWVAGGDKFEVMICKSERQLTVFVFLPMPPPVITQGPGGRPAAKLTLRPPRDVYRFS